MKIKIMNMNNHIYAWDKHKAPRLFVRIRMECINCQSLNGKYAWYLSIIRFYGNFIHSGQYNFKGCIVTISWLLQRCSSFIFIRFFFSFNCVTYPGSDDILDIVKNFFLINEKLQFQ